MYPTQTNVNVHCNFYRIDMIERITLVKQRLQILCTNTHNIAGNKTLLNLKSIININSNSD